MHTKMKHYAISGFEIEIEHAAYARLDSKWKSRNVCDPFSRLYYVKSGEGYVVCNGEKIMLTPGNIYLIPSETVFDYGCDGRLEKMFFHIYINTLERYDLLANVNKICQVPFAATEFDDLKKCMESGDYMKLIRLKQIIYDTMLRMTEKYGFKGVPIKQYSDGVKKAMEYIHHHTRIDLNTELVSEKVFISKSKLRKDFKQETGVPIGKYIDDMVFFKAKRLLNKGYLSINEISQKLGFCDQFYFSRRFKERYGEPPSEYRRKIMLEKNKGEEK